MGNVVSAIQESRTRTYFTGSVAVMSVVKGNTFVLIIETLLIILLEKLQLLGFIEFLWPTPGQIQVVSFKLILVEYSSVVTSVFELL